MAQLAVRGRFGRTSLSTQIATVRSLPRVFARGARICCALAAANTPRRARWPRRGAACSSRAKSRCFELLRVHSRPRSRKALPMRCGGRSREGSHSHRVSSPQRRLRQLLQLLQLRTLSQPQLPRQSSRRSSRSLRRQQQLQLRPQRVRKRQQLQLHPCRRRHQQLLLKSKALPSRLQRRRRSRRLHLRRRLLVQLAPTTLSSTLWRGWPKRTRSCTRRDLEHHHICDGYCVRLSAVCAAFSTFAGGCRPREQ